MTRTCRPTPPTASATDAGHLIRRSLRKTFVLLVLAAVAIPAPGRSMPLEDISQLALGGNRDQALRHLEEFLRARPDDFEARLLKGNLLAETGQLEQAEVVFASLIEKFPHRPEAFNNLAVLQAREGRYEEAAESLLGALGTHPSYQAAYRNLGKVYGQVASQAYGKALGVKPRGDSQKIDLVLLGGPNPVASPPPPEASSNPVPPASESAGRLSRGAAPSPPLEPLPQTLEPSQAPAPAEGDPVSVVRSWARAWSEQRVEDHLEHYSLSFRPEDGSSRSHWEARRRSRLESSSFIRVTLRNLRTVPMEPDRAEVTFTQSYTSDTYSDVVEKRLLLQREAGTWRILEEEASP